MKTILTIITAALLMIVAIATYLSEREYSAIAKLTK